MKVRCRVRTAAIPFLEFLNQQFRCATPDPVSESRRVVSGPASECRLCMVKQTFQATVQKDCCCEGLSDTCRAVPVACAEHWQVSDNPLQTRTNGLSNNLFRCSPDSGCSVFNLRFHQAFVCSGMVNGLVGGRPELADFVGGCRATINKNSSVTCLFCL